MKAYPGSRWWQKPSPGCQIDRDGEIPPPSALFLLNENGGLTAYDIAGGNSGTLDATTMWNSGNFGPSIDTASGTKKLNVAAPNTNVNNLLGIQSTATPSYATFLFWAKLTASPSASGALAYKSNNLTAGWYAQITAGNQYQFIGAPSGAFFQINLPSSKTPAVGAWGQIAWVVNGPTNATLGHAAYINGAAVSPTFNAGSGNYSDDSSLALQIGNGGSGSGALKGQIDHIAFWKGTALTAAQIARLYQDPFAYILKPALRRFYTPGASGAALHSFPLLHCGA